MATIDMAKIYDRGTDRRERRDRMKRWLQETVGPIVTSNEVRDGNGPSLKGHAVHYYGDGWKYIIAWSYNSEEGKPVIFSEQEDVIIDDDVLAVQFKLTFL